jgi:hypothetical protein
MHVKSSVHYILLWNSIVGIKAFGSTLESYGPTINVNWILLLQSFIYDGFGEICETKVKSPNS